jgi:hypothetical protein
MNIFLRTKSRHLPLLLIININLYKEYRKIGLPRSKVADAFSNRDRSKTSFGLLRSGSKTIRSFFYNLKSCCQFVG